MAKRAIFKGYGLNAVDAKGRVAIPAPFRQAIEKTTDSRTLTIALPGAGPVLHGYGPDRSEWLMDQLDRMENAALDAGRSFDRLRMARERFGRSEDVPFDASGRFILPPLLRTRAVIDLGGWIFFNGLGDLFDMWSPAALFESDDVDEIDKDICRQLMRDRGAA